VSARDIKQNPQGSADFGLRYMSRMLQIQVIVVPFRFSGVALASG
jgi:hypothetical protein